MLYQEIKSCLLYNAFTLKIKIKLTSKKTKNDKTYTTRLLNKFLKKKKKKAKKKKKTYFFSSFYYEALEQVGNWNQSKCLFTCWFCCVSLVHHLLGFYQIPAHSLCIKSEEAKTVSWSETFVSFFFSGVFLCTLRRGEAAYAADTTRCYIHTS